MKTMILLVGREVHAEIQEERQWQKQFRQERAKIGEMMSYRSKKGPKNHMRLCNDNEAREAGRVRWKARIDASCTE